MEDLTSSQTLVLNYTSSTSDQNAVANTSFIIRLKWITMTEHFLWPPEYVLHELLLKSHEKQSNCKSWKGGFRALSKLVYL